MQQLAVPGSEGALQLFFGAVAITFVLLVISALISRSNTGRGVLPTMGRAASVVGANFGAMLFLAALNGGIGAVVISWVGSLVHDYVVQSYRVNNPQVALLASELPQQVMIWIWGGSVGSFTMAASLYFWVQRETNREATFRESINYALNRFHRIWKPHTKALGIILLGNIVLVPGIWFALQYAFVDAIATLDSEEKDPLARSKRLTFGRRGSIFRSFLIFGVWWFAYQLPVRLGFQDLGTAWIFLGGTVDHFVVILLDLCFIQYYLNIFRKSA